MRDGRARDCVTIDIGALRLRVVARRAAARTRERGIALIMVLGAIAVLTVILAEFQDETSTEVAAALADRDSVVAEYMARSAFNLSRLLIASEPTLRNAISPLFALLKKKPPQLPVWEYSDRMLGAFNDQTASTDFSSALGLDITQGKNLGMPGGHFELTIVDEDAKLNVNLGASNDIAHIRLAKEIMGLVSPPQYSPLFDQRDAKGQYNDRLTTCAAIIDWADVDETQFNCDTTQTAPGNGPVEDAFYQLLDKPYRRKNAPYDSLDELHMVRGVSDDFWATFIDPDPTNPKKRVMTVWGQGAVNVNTANAQTLLALVCSQADKSTEICNDPTQAATFLTGVTMARGITMGAPLFGSAQDFLDTMKGTGQLGPLLAAMGMKPVKFLSESEFQKSVTTESKMFSIYAVGVVKGYKRETRTSLHAVVDFRAAPALTSSPATGTAPGASPKPATTTPSGTSADAIAAALQPSTGGQVVYYRVE
jgi:general secretion pathway protein K